MVFKLRVRCDNAAFSGGNAASELGRILKEVAAKLEQFSPDGPIMDASGNRVGIYGFTDDQ